MKGDSLYAMYGYAEIYGYTVCPISVINIENESIVPPNVTVGHLLLHGNILGRKMQSEI